MLLSFILEVASEVLAGTISDLIMGRSRIARKAEIETEVHRLLSQHMSYQNMELKRILVDVMKEVEVLSKRDPDLVVSANGISLKDNRKPDFQPKRQTKRQIEDQMYKRLFTLGRNIEQRRHELGLPLSPLEHEKNKVTTSKNGASSQGTEVEWEQIRPKRLPSKWEQEFRDMDQRIRQRRSGQ